MTKLEQVIEHIASRIACDMTEKERIYEIRWLLTQTYHDIQTLEDDWDLDDFYERGK